MSKKWALLFAGAFAFFFINAYNMPINQWDDVLYASHRISGGEADTSVLARGSSLWAYIYNAANLQWQEYLVWHGRFTTHTFMRLALGAPGILPYLINALAMLLVAAGCTSLIKPGFSKELNRENGFAFAFFTALCFVGLFSFYSATFRSYSYLYSTFFSAALIALFFSPYFNLISQENPAQPRLWQIVLLGLLGGNSHEVAAAGFPMMLIIYGVLRARKTPVPPWFWPGFACYFIGFIPHFPLPSQTRILIYGDAAAWQFMGQTLDWTALGPARYLYSFVRHIFLTTDPWFIGPGWLPSTWHLQLIFLIFTALNFRKVRSFGHSAVLVPLLLFVFTWGIVSSLMFSPMAHWNTIDQCRLFLFIALGSALTYFFRLYPFPRVQRGAALLLGATPIILGLFFIPPMHKAAREFRTFSASARAAQAAGQASLSGPKEISAIVFGAKIYEYALQPTLNECGITQYNP